MCGEIPFPPWLLMGMDAVKHGLMDVLYGKYDVCICLGGNAECLLLIGTGWPGVVWSFPPAGNMSLSQLTLTDCPTRHILQISLNI